MKVMSGLDARFLYSETSTAHMHTIKVVIVDVSARSEPLTEGRLVDALSQRLGRMPVLRRRIVPVPHGLGQPVIIDDPTFDVHRHIHHRLAEPPGGASELAAIVSHLTSTALPRDRPLWDLTVVEGLAGGDVAFVMKIHHALADGAAAVALLANAFVTDESEAIIEEFRAEPMPSRGALYRAAGMRTREAARTIPSVLRDSIIGLRRGRAARRTEAAPITGPFAGPRTRFNVSLQPERTFATLALPLAPMHEMRRAAGASLNDAFLTICAGGLRRYLGRTGDLPAKALVAAVPMATRAQPDRLDGNHVDNIFVSLHTDVADPIERLQAVHASSAAARRVRMARGTDLFERRAELIPPAVHTLTTRSWSATGLADRVRPPLNVVVSCVAGPRAPLALDGGVITALYSSGPILEGIGLNITAWSYVDTMYVSVLGCPSSLPDPWTLVADLEHEMAECSSPALLPG